MGAQLWPGQASLLLVVDRPYEEDGVTPRDDLVGMKVWVATTPGLNPVGPNNEQVIAPVFDGPSLSCEIGGLEPGTLHYVRYALVSSVDPTYLDASEVLTATPESASSGGSSVSVVLSNESHTVPASFTGAVESYAGSGTSIEVFEGTEALQAGGSTPGTFTVEVVEVSPANAIVAGSISYSGYTAAVGSHSNMLAAASVATIVYKVTVNTLHGDVVRLTKTQSITKAKAGSAGAAATAYWMLKSAGAVAKAVTGAMTPTAVTFSAMSQTGSGAASAYAGRFIIATSTDGVNFTNQYTSAANESSKAYTLPAGIKAVRARLYLAGGTTTLLDEELVPVVSDGATGDPGAQGPAGANSVVATLSNEAHVFPASLTGAVTSYLNSGTVIRVYEGTTELTYDGIGTANGTWKVTTAASNITRGTLTPLGAGLSVNNHSGVATGTDLSLITYTISGKTAAGASFLLTKDQSFTKAKAGATGSPGAPGSDGAPGAQGPAVVITANRATTFTATDGTLDTGQANITFTALVSGIASPTFVWSFTGFQTPPTNSGTSAVTVTPAQFGTSKSATVKCVVSGNSNYTDFATVVRLEKSTAAAGANATYVDSSGKIQGVGAGAGTPVNNEAIKLREDGTLVGGGADSEQVNLTHIPGTLSADRIVTGTLQAGQKIIVGSDTEGLVIDGGSRSIAVSAKRQWVTYVFSTSAAPIAVGSPWTGIPPGYFDVPQPSWTSPNFYMFVTTVGADGLVKSSIREVVGGSSSYDDRWSFANIPSATTRSEIALDSSIIWHPHSLPAAPAGHSVWARRYYVGGRLVPLSTSVMFKVSGDTFEDLGVYTPVKFGNLGSSYGMEGITDKGATSFKLDNTGLYISPTSESLWAFGGAYGWKTLTEGSEIQTYTGASSSSTGTTTTYIKLIDSVDFTIGETHRVFASVVGVFDRVNWNTQAVTYEFNSRYFTTQLFESAAGVITSMGDVNIATDTTASTNFPATKASIVVDTDGTLTGQSAGAYLKLVSRTMYDSNNATYGDWTRWKYVVWSLEGA